MKKFLVLSLVCFLFMPSLTFAATNDLTGIVLEQNNNTLVVVAANENSENFHVYKMSVSGECRLSDFVPGDVFLVNGQDADYLTKGDLITNKISLIDWSEESEIEYSNCQLSVVNLDDAYFDLYMASPIAGNNFVLQSMNYDSYAAQISNSCANELTSETILLVKERDAGNLNANDLIQYGIVENNYDDFTLLNLNNCNIISAKPVVNNGFELISTNKYQHKVTISDYWLEAIIEVTVNADCQILDLQGPSDYGYGDIYYNYNSYPNYEWGITYNEAAFLNYGSYINDGYDWVSYNCLISNFTIIGEGDAQPPTNLYDGYYYERPTMRPLPVMQNYYLRGQQNKKIYTDRPEPSDLVGLIIKGETDPATYTVDSEGKLRWLANEQVAKRLYGQDWDSQIIWFTDSIIYTYKFGDSIYE